MKVPPWLNSSRSIYTALSILESYPDLATSSPSSSVGICSDPCRQAAKIGSVPTEGGGGIDVFPTALQSLSQREGYRSAS